MRLFLLLCIPCLYGFVISPNLSIRSAQRPTLKSMQEVDDCCPSDTGDEITTARRAVSTDEYPQLRETIKKELFVIAASTNRGVLANQEEKDAVMDLVYQLEAMNPTPVTTDLSLARGTWELVFSDVQLFRGSPFFMSIGELMTEDKSRAESAFALHRMATSNSEIGRVRQMISDTELVSEIDLKVGLLAGLPYALEGTVVSKAKLEVMSNDSFSLTATGTTVKKSNLLPFLDGSNFLPVDQVFSALNQGSTPAVKLSTFYLDDDLRISRDSYEHVYVYTRVGVI